MKVTDFSICVQIKNYWYIKSAVTVGKTEYDTENYWHLKSTVRHGLS
jgi:hypothetical protein